MTTTTLRDTTLAAIPGYSDDNAKAARLKAAIIELGSRDYMRAARRALTDTVSAITDGEPADLAKIVRDLADARTADAAHIEVRQALTDHLSLFSTTAASEGRYPLQQIRPAFNVLREALTDVVRDVKAVHALLGPVQSADEAVRAGGAAVDAWRQLDELVARYEEIRETQSLLYRLARTGSPDYLARSMAALGIFADAIDVDPRLQFARAENARRSPVTSQSERAWKEWLQSAPPAGWPAPIDETTTWLTDDHHAYLRWSCTAAQPWMPDPAQLEEAGQLASVALSMANGNGNTAGKERSRAAYYRLTGAKPRASFADGEAAELEQHPAHEFVGSSH